MRKIDLLRDTTRALSPYDIKLVQGRRFRHVHGMSFYTGPVCVKEDL